MSHKDDLTLITIFLFLLIATRIPFELYLTTIFQKRRIPSKPKNRHKLVQQSSLLLTRLLLFTYGLTILLPPSLTPSSPWISWPTPPTPPSLRRFYLLQAAFRLQQIGALLFNAVVRKEKKRDFWVMVGHHVITLGLIWGSWVYRFVRIGVLIYVVMDAVDVTMPPLKILSYLGMQQAANRMFWVFAFTWLFTRHVLFPVVIYSVYRDAPRILPMGFFDTTVPYQRRVVVSHRAVEYWRPMWDSAAPIAFDRNVYKVFLGTLLGLQAVLLPWTVMLIPLMVKTWKGVGVKDVRSGDEGEERDEKGMEEAYMATVEANMQQGDEVDVEGERVDDTAPLRQRVAASKEVYC